MTLLDTMQKENIGQEHPVEENVQSFLRRFSAAENLGNLDDVDDLTDELSDDHINDQIGATTAKLLQPLRDQVGNMGVDVAMLEETLQNLAAQTEEANTKIVQVTNFVVDLIERLEDIDDKARALLEKWKEESRAISDFTEHADEMTERFSVTVKLQEDKMCQLTELLNRLEGETKRLSFIPSKSNSPKTAEEAEEAAKNLLVDDPENIDFHSKRKAFYAIGEKMKTNDTFQTFKAKKESHKASSTCSLERTGVENETSESAVTGETETDHVTEKQSRAATPDRPTDTQTNSDKGRSVLVPLLICLLIAVIACLVACVLDPEATTRMRTVLGSFGSSRNSKVPT
ncbi:hypothetical protein ACHWQZ_G019364 [Mnemiopsis leidyi]